jgi:hypothetical protein
MTVILSVTSAQAMFLWQAEDARGASCCLHYGDQDICNPYVPCSGHVASDLGGIADYLNRLLHLDKIDANTYFKSLQNAFDLVESLINTNTFLNYRMDYHHSVTFLHQQIELAKTTDKTKSAAPSTAEKQKQNEEAVLKYLMKIGAAWKVR